MQKTILLLSVLFLFTTASAQDKNLYHPDANADQDIKEAIKKAGAENKYVLVQGGGNWCSWCIEFARFCKADPKIDSVSIISP